MNIELPLDGNSRNRLRPLSKVFFNSEYAFEAYLLIATEPRFYASQISAVTGCQPSFANAFLKRLEAENLVERLSKEDGQLRNYMRRSSSPIWSVLLQMGEAILAQPAAEVTRLPTGT